MDYLLYGIGWSTVQKMMIDAPSYDFDNHSDDDDIEHGIVESTEENSQKIMDYFNSLNG